MRRWIPRVFSLLAIVTIVSLVCMTSILHSNQTINSITYGKSYVSYVYVNTNCQSEPRAPNCKNNTRNGDILRNSGINFDSALNPFVRNHNDTVFLWKENLKYALSIFTLSAIGVNNTNITNNYTKMIKLNSWEALKHRKVGIKCCVIWQNGRFSSYESPPKSYYKLSSRLSATQYTCPIRGDLHDVKGVALQFKFGKCSKTHLNYIKPFIPKKQKQHSFAICLKIVYGEIDVTNLVHWLEYYKEMKVDKVFMFTYNISTTVDETIIHYIKQGFVQRRIFNFPWKGPAGLKRDVGIKNKNAWQDEQVVVFDCVQRLSGYTYVAILDLDEYLLPKKYTNFKEFMLHLTFQYPLSAGFTFKSYLFVKDWGISGALRGADVEKYIMRTPAILTRQKNVMFSARVIESSVNTHNFTPKAGFKHIIVPQEMGALNHYRSCYPNLMNTCDNPDLQFTDTRILDIVRRYRNRTLWIKNLGDNDV